MIYKTKLLINLIIQAAHLHSSYHRWWTGGRRGGGWAVGAPPPGQSRPAARAARPGAPSAHPSPCRHNNNLVCRVSGSSILGSMGIWCPDPGLFVTKVRKLLYLNFKGLQVHGEAYSSSNTILTLTILVNHAGSLLVPFYKVNEKPDRKIAQESEKSKVNL